MKEDLSEEGMSWDELEELTKKCNILYLRGVQKRIGKIKRKKKMKSYYL